MQREENIEQGYTNGNELKKMSIADEKWEERNKRMNSTTESEMHLTNF